MSITTIIPGQQLYTLLVTDTETGQRTLSTYNSNPILTTDHDCLMQYTQILVNHFGTGRTYTISTVTPVHTVELEIELNQE